MFRCAQINVLTRVCYCVAELSEAVIATHIIPLADDENVNPGDTYANGIWAPAPPPLPPSLADVKSAKLTELATARDAAIYSTFQSSGLGTVKTYGYNTKAAENFAKQTALMAFDPTIDQVQWATLEDGFVWHTRAQFAQVIKDGDAHDRSGQFKGWQLEAQVKAIVENATTTEAQAITQVLAITW